jgi:hypothetical protein
MVVFMGSKVIIPDLIIVTILLLIIFLPLIIQIYLGVTNKEIKDFKTKIKKIIIRSSLLLIIIASIFFTLNTINFLDYKSPMKFKEYSSISFTDFKGLEFLKKELYGSKEFAYIYTSIETKIEDKKITIESYFHPSRSYVYNKNINSKDLLSHELYHFRITELYSRKIKKRISELKVCSTKNIENIIKKGLKEENEYQKKYDYDTFHSYVLKEQKKYERTIDSLLDLHTKYQLPIITCHEKK